ncbi:conserved hypothetical protein [Desulforapulum autotrophicum HRM2]|uniref:Uncharacterized protein n=1 Tax=Desulforapulum autotrophicum (strain ATCC 43914 / DSM 3382 / VKM B-1955 / HRM2) TaxID=177437 RepID=C0QJL3_DESAH|nr:TCAD7 domain-containing protein [Desulforapulum autotrophicum]ACN13866.1 conserved hypothetical protein [Desulforapulum autotrophicum HRM2]
MKRITRSAGKIIFILPDTASDLNDVSLPGKQRLRGLETKTDSVNQELETLLTALTETKPQDLAEQDYHILDGFSLDLGEQDQQTKRRGVSAKPDEMEINVTLEPDEGAILLLEQEGTYEWHFAGKTALHRGPKQRGRTGGVYQKTALFRIPVGDGIAPRQRGSSRVHRGPVTNFIKGKIKGFILKFAVKKAVGALSKRLEKGVEPGPVIITSHEDTNGWYHKEDFLSVELPHDRPARILLLVHGTFSSTIGSYGALTEQPAGRRFLGLALDQYDAILGYDHYTLAETPAQNAENLFDELLKLLEKSKGIEIDAISFSRGGLVYRYLTEQIVPFEKTQLAFRKAIFVACTNGGTELANDENWKYLVDSYTNILAGASRLLGKLPNAKLPMVIFRQSVKTIGSLVKYMAQDAVQDNAVPGLSAMEPGGQFVTAINTRPLTRTRPGASSYYAIGSDFEPDKATYRGELGKRLVIKVADGLVDRLMGEANDLVVDTDSMFVIDPVCSAKLLEKLPFGKNGEIYHTVYFSQPQVARQCSQWLGLIQTNRAVAKNAPRSWWKEAVSDDFQIVPGQLSVKEVEKNLENDDARFVIVERPFEGELLHYGIPRKILNERIASHPNKEDALVEILDLHEYHAREISLEDALEVGNANELSSRSGLELGRYASVIFAHTGPVGVVAPPEILSSEELQKEVDLPQLKSLPQPARSSQRNTSPQRGLERTARSMSRGATRGVVLSTPDQRMEDLSAQPPTVWCNAHANMPEEAVIGKKATVEVVLSRDEIIRQIGVSGGGNVQVDKALIVQILARRHCITSGESRLEVPVPAKGEETLLFFDVMPKNEGVGEVNVIVRQGNRPIANLKLYPRFVVKVSGEIVEETIAEAELTPVDDRPELSNVLYIREGEMGLKQVLHFLFESRSLNKFVTCTSQPFENQDARKEYIKNLYEDLENFWADDELEYNTFMRKLQARGVEIFDKLIPLALRKVLWEERESLETIQVFSDEPFIPWELAYLKEPGKKAVRNSYFLAEKGLVRWLAEDGQFPPQKLRLRDGKALYVIPDYPPASGYQLPGAQAEKLMLTEVLSANAISPVSSEVLDAIEKPGRFDILHFACHGLANPNLIWDSGLLMEGKMKNGSYRQDNLLSSQVEAFADLQEPDESYGPLVFLNACQVGRQGYNIAGTGGFAKAFVKSGAGAFISTHWSVGDSSALDFSKTLYKQLLAGNNMMTAVAAARKAAKNMEEMTWLSYVVYGDPYAKLMRE